MRHLEEISRTTLQVGSRILWWSIWEQMMLPLSISQSGLTHRLENATRCAELQRGIMI